MVTWREMPTFAPIHSFEIYMIKEFFSLLKRYMKPYRKYLTWAVILNFLSQWLNVFSFAALVPILNILFKIDTTKYEYMPMDIHHLNKDVLINNGYYFINYIIEQNGAFVTLIFMGLILIVMTLLKTTGYFASAAVMVPLRTGIVRDIRIEVYNKVLRLPLSFFSEERKGDIIARMSADVSVVENSLTSSLDMLIRNPIALVVCFITLFTVSWQLTLFVLVILPLAGWVMGSVSRKLKSQSVVAQGQWGDIMSQLDETLGGLRIIKAFIAERKMSERFAKINNGFRDAMNAMVIRQSSAHPMSEFLGTCVIVIVLWFGGALILNQYSPIDAAMFIFYLVILYSIINPLKEFSKAFYNIPLGLASMERIDMILKAENHIKEPERPLPLTDFEHLHIPDHTEVYEINGPYFFGIANRFEEVVLQTKEQPKVRIIRMRKVPFIDSTGIHNLTNLCEMSHREGVHIILSGVNPKVHEVLKKSGFYELLGKKNICDNIHTALEVARHYLNR